MRVVDEVAEDEVAGRVGQCGTQPRRRVKILLAEESPHRENRRRQGAGERDHDDAATRPRDDGGREQEVDAEIGKDCSVPDPLEHRPDCQQENAAPNEHPSVEIRRREERATDSRDENEDDGTRSEDAVPCIHDADEEVLFVGADRFATVQVPVIVQNDDAEERNGARRIEARIAFQAAARGLCFACDHQTQTVASGCTIVNGR